MRVAVEQKCGWKLSKARSLGGERVAEPLNPEDASGIVEALTNSSCPANSDVGTTSSGDFHEPHAASHLCTSHRADAHRFQHGAGRTTVDRDRVPRQSIRPHFAGCISDGAYLPSR